MRTARVKRAIVIGLALVLLGASSVYAATNVINAIGTVAHHAPFGGPATMTARNLLIGANEVLAWHVHPGVGAYTIVKSGTLTVDDGCGGEPRVYSAGSAFIEPANRVHRGRAGSEPVETVQTFLVPAGMAFSTNVAQSCGAPLAVDECKGGGWAAFNYPRAFANQGDCVQYVINGGAG